MRGLAGLLSAPVLLLMAVALSLTGCAPARGLPATPPTLVPTFALQMPTQPVELPSATLPLATPAQHTFTPPALTVAAQTPEVEDTATPGLATARLPTRTRWPTNTPTITPTPTPPLPDPNLVRPGQLSKVVSPIQAEIYAVSGGDAKVTVELIGEDGRVISRQVEDYQRPGRYIWFAPKIPFEITAAAEMARLQVVTRDTFGRLERLMSTDLILLSVGRNEINPPAITQAPYLVRQPKEDAQIVGGVLEVEGQVRPVNDSPLIIELVAENGSVVVTKQVIVAPPTGDLSHTPISIQIPYKVNRPTPVRLTLRQEGSRIPGTVALTSRTIVLAP